MTGAGSDQYIAARRTLLTALEALRPHLKAIVIVGAQAIYLHTGKAELAVAPFTIDAAPDGRPHPRSVTLRRCTEPCFPAISCLPSPSTADDLLQHMLPPGRLDPAFDNGLPIQIDKDSPFGRGRAAAIHAQGMQPLASRDTYLVCCRHSVSFARRRSKLSLSHNLCLEGLEPKDG